MKKTYRRILLGALSFAVLSVLASNLWFSYKTYSFFNNRVHSGSLLEEVNSVKQEKLFKPKLKENQELRSILVEELQKAIQKYKADAGQALIMDVNDASILASISMQNSEGSIVEKLPDKNFTQVSSVGSVFKVFNMAAALDSNSVQLTDLIDTSLPLKVAGARMIEDYRGQARPQKLPETLILSSNIGSAKIALKMGQVKQKTFFKKLGFFDKLPIKDIAEPIYSKSNWNEVQITRASYGYGLSVPPVQLAAGMSAMINGGIYNSPYESKEKGLRVISKEVSEMMRQLMWGVVQYEAPKDSVQVKYAVGGKSGSHQLFTDGRAEIDKLGTYYVAAFPMNKPKYLIYASLDNPQKLKETFMFNTAGWNVKPLVMNIISKMVEKLKLEEVKDWEHPSYITNALENCRKHRGKE